MQPSDLSELRERAADVPPAAISPLNLAALKVLDRASLLQLWQALWGRAAPARASRSLLRYGVAWRIQERSFGGLSAASRRRLRSIAQNQRRSAHSPGARHALNPSVARATP
jgi:hypothetical protein